MQLEYELDEIPPKKVLIALSLQWFAIISAILIIGGKVVAEIQFDQPFEKVVYIQKVFFISGITILAQLFMGHRLPLVVGPASVLIAGMYASLEAGFDAIYTSIAIGGVILFFLGTNGSLNIMRKLFTDNIVAVVLILVALALTPAIMDLIISDTVVGYNITFSILFVLLLFTLNRKLSGFWNASLILWSLIIGSIVYHLIFPKNYELVNPSFVSILHDFNLSPSFRPELIFSFIIYFLALAINDLSSIYSLTEMLKIRDAEIRAKRGIKLTGLSNILSGIFGVVGTVNYSMSPGIIYATRCASRYALIPAGLTLLVISFSPIIISLVELIPKVVIGSVFLYIMCSQVAVGLSMVKVRDINSGLVISLPLLLSIIVTFLPESALNSFPHFLRPIVGNGFVLGILVAILMEHLIFGRRKEKLH